MSVHPLAFATSGNHMILIVSDIGNSNKFLRILRTLRAGGNLILRYEKINPRTWFGICP